MSDGPNSLAPRTVTVMNMAESETQDIPGLIGLTILDALARLKPGVAPANLSVFVNRSPISPADYATCLLEPGDLLGFSTNKEGGAASAT